MFSYGNADTSAGFGVEIMGAKASMILTGNPTVVSTV
jgi:hypothetical protein